MTIMIIPAAGTGSRMGLPSDGLTKCLLPVAGRPIIDSLADVALDHALPVRVLRRPDDSHLQRWALAKPGRIETIDAPLEPYGTTVLRALRDDTHAVVTDSDLLLPPGELDSFLRHCAGHPGDTGLTVGTTGYPQDQGARTLWWNDAPSGQRIGRGVSDHPTRLTGIYCLRAAAIERLRAFASSGGTSFGVFLSEYPVDDVDCFVFSYGYNINTPDDLAAARDRAGEANTSGGDVSLNPSRPAMPVADAR